MYSTSQKLIAEFLGTFALIFFGAGSICTDQYLHGAGGLGLLGIALAHGLAIGIMVSALGPSPRTFQSRGEPSASGSPSV